MQLRCSKIACHFSNSELRFYYIAKMQFFLFLRADGNSLDFTDPLQEIENRKWNFYKFRTGATTIWNYDLVGPSFTLSVRMRAFPRNLWSTSLSYPRSFPAHSTSCSCQRPSVASCFHAKVNNLYSIINYHDVVVFIIVSHTHITGNKLPTTRQSHSDKVHYDLKGTHPTPT